jgi:hypothetical protein
MTSKTNRRGLLKAAVVVGASAAALPMLPRILPKGQRSTTAVPRADAATAVRFRHPGMLHTQADFDRMAAGVKAGAQPYEAGWNKLAANGRSRSNWRARPLKTVIRGGVGQNFPQLYNDIHAAYQNALRWRISGDKTHGDAARDILNAWSATLTTITGNADRFLAAGIYGYQFANAAEIMRGYPGFDVNRFQTMLLNIFYPLNDQFLVKHNDAYITNYWANWDLCNMASIMAIGIFCDERTYFDRIVAYFKDGPGNGSIMHAVPFLHPGGLAQWQESGRDQGHTMMGIGLLGTICEMAWNQGVDLYGYADNRFMKAAEYVAKYNLGQNVPFTTYTWRSGRTGTPQQQTVISSAARGQDRPVWELVYNHYAVRQGMNVPNIAAYAALVRAEGGGGDYGPNSGGFDALGFGTLTATRTKNEAEAPTGLLPTGVSRFFRPVNSPKEYIAANRQLGVLGTAGMAFKIVPGLGDAKGYSFVDVNGHYLRHRNFRITFDANDGTALFKKDATFTAEPGSPNGSITLQSVNYPARVIRHRNHQLWLDPRKDTEAFRADSSFTVTA